MLTGKTLIPRVTILLRYLFTLMPSRLVITSCPASVPTVDADIPDARMERAKPVPAMGPKRGFRTLYVSLNCWISTLGRKPRLTSRGSTRSRTWLPTGLGGSPSGGSEELLLGELVGLLDPPSVELVLRQRGVEPQRMRHDRGADYPHDDEDRVLAYGRRESMDDYLRWVEAYNRELVEEADADNRDEEHEGVLYQAEAAVRQHEKNEDVGRAEEAR